ncbi:MAG: hypothetical protein M3O77_00195 [Chloroflexota bacterium]|nr:hypothetical protein [Chloroflexota bacterium]
MRPSIRRLARPATVLGSLAVLTSGLLFVGRSSDPMLADPPAEAARSAALRDAGLAAAIALERLHAALETALAAGRDGTAATVNGDTDPAPALTRAAERVGAARGPASVAIRAVDRLSGISNAEGSALPPLQVGPNQLATIVGQLRSAVEPASTFASMRGRTERTVAELGSTLAALERGDPRSALEAADRAEGELAAIRAWKADLVTLPLWIKTTDRLLAALRRGSEALISGDAATLGEARRQFAAAAVEAHRADLALGIAIAEGGSSIADPALRGLAHAIAEVERSADAVASVMRQVGER